MSHINEQTGTQIKIFHLVDPNKCLFEQEAFAEQRKYIETEICYRARDALPTSRLNSARLYLCCEENHIALQYIRDRIIRCAISTLSNNPERSTTLLDVQELLDSGELFEYAEELWDYQTNKFRLVNTPGWWHAYKDARNKIQFLIDGN